ncbi:MAG: hypothetical protein AAF682_24390 [Planctomycetota bacterium]
MTYLFNDRAINSITIPVDGEPGTTVGLAYRDGNHYHFVLPPPADRPPHLNHPLLFGATLANQTEAQWIQAVHSVWKPGISRYLTGTSTAYTELSQLSSVLRRRFFPDAPTPEVADDKDGGFEEEPLEVDVGTTGLLQYQEASQTFEVMGRVERYTTGDSYSEYVVLAPGFVQGISFELKGLATTPFPTFEQGMSMILHTGTETSVRP